MSEFIQVTTTSDRKETLLAMAEELVALRLAACVQIGGPIESIYRWQERLETTQEWFADIKSVSRHQQRIEQVILDRHHYEEPQITITPLVGGSASYLEWLRQQCTD